VRCRGLACTVVAADCKKLSHVSYPSDWPAVLCLIKNLSINTFSFEVTFPQSLRMSLLFFVRVVQHVYPYLF
jgi:hypothetical protein